MILPPPIERLIIKSNFYLDAAKFLYIHRILVQPTDRNYLNGIWGKLASEILMQNWDAALEDLKRLQQFIDESTFGSSLQLLQQRTWLIHWSLFVFFNHPKGRDLIIELFLYQKQYLNAIQTTCPWILRYLSTAVIINKNSRWVVCWFLFVFSEAYVNSGYTLLWFTKIWIFISHISGATSWKI